MKKRDTNFLHDHFFKEVFSRREYCLDIFKLVLTPAQFKLFDWTTLRSEVTISVDKEWREKRADLVFSARLKDKKTPVKIIFIIEHKAGQDPNLLLQLLKYQVDRYLEESTPIIPILVYHGQQKKWRTSLNFHESLKLAPPLKRTFGKNILDFTCKLLNVHDIPRGKPLKTGPIFYIMGSIWKVRGETLEQLFKIGSRLNNRDREALLKRAVDYARTYNRSLTWQIIRDIEEQTVPKEKRIMPPLKISLDLATEEGMQKGLKKGRKEVARKMLKDGLKQDTISRYTGLTKKELAKLKK